MSMWRRSGPRRLSTSRVNVRRRLTNRVTSTLAALVIAGGYFLWNTYIAPTEQATAPVAEAREKPVKATTTRPTTAATAQSTPIDALIEARRSNEMVTVTATVARVLPDDKDGSQHQKFLLDLPSGNRVLVAHNIDLATRVDGLSKGDTVTVRGEFEWSDRGGVIHWTHHDPAARHQAGWIERDGRKYE